MKKISILLILSVFALSCKPRIVYTPNPDFEKALATDPNNRSFKGVKKTILHDQKKYKEVIKMWQDEACDNTYLKGKSYMSIAYCYSLLSEEDSVKVYLNKALDNRFSIWWKDNQDFQQKLGEASIKHYLGMDKNQALDEFYRDVDTTKLDIEEKSRLKNNIESFETYLKVLYQECYRTF